MTRPVAVIGGAAVPCGKLMEKPDVPVQVLEHEVLARCVLDAVEDAGIEKTRIGSLVFSHPRVYTRQLYFATFMAHYLRLPADGIVMEVLGNGMTGGLAFDQAIDQVASGRADVALALGTSFELGADTAAHLNNTMRATGDVDFQSSCGFTPIAWYAMDAVRYMHEFGATREQIAMVAVKNRSHAVHNPLAQYRKPITLEEVLNQRMIVEPLGLLEVPPRSDGAVCVVVASEEVARQTGRPYARVRGRGFHHEGAHQISEVPSDMTAFTPATIAAQRAYAQAGVKASDMDFAEIYAPCTIVEVCVSEAISLVARGQGAAAAAAGETTLGGRIPICTSGGLQSRGHPPYVTPLYSVIEALEQLRHRAGERQVRDAALGLTICELGNYNAALMHVMEAVA
ncbi:thiolase family protein [Ramlibacter sp. RBP-2]|uniref:Thiolase family protein n=1 Tax=Ramlibacter lithotrophicus TaxID=2606681 RepID=A0A7X6I8Y6_9BURK|nr:thiolase family protein [Ramlibacter lithotrophicus]NKE68873.1 thiolase family protein [Ramlibacter lithotrophicus]